MAKIPRAFWQRRLSPRLLLDIIGGAVDARLQPQVRAYEGDVMTMGFLKRCAVGGPQLSRSDQLMGSAAIVGFSLSLRRSVHAWRRTLSR